MPSLAYVIRPASDLARASSGLTLFSSSHQQPVPSLSHCYLSLAPMPLSLRAPLAASHPSFLFRMDPPPSLASFLTYVALA